MAPNMKRIRAGDINVQLWGSMDLYDYPSFQQKSKCAHISVTQCILNMFDNPSGTVSFLRYFCTFSEN